MNSNKTSIEKRKINGQLILFPSYEDWQILKLEPYIDNTAITADEFLWLCTEIVFKYSELYIGLGYISLFDKWRPYVFIKIDSQFQRVHLERLICKHCGWKGYTLNPLSIDPYIGDGINQDMDTLMKLTDKYPVLPCPKCQKKLPRHPIWVEPFNEE